MTVQVYMTNPKGKSFVAMDSEAKITKDLKIRNLACGDRAIWNAHVKKHAEMLQELVDQIDLAIVSWYRTPQDNAERGGASNSLHLLGLATDIQADEDPTEYWREICKKYKVVGGCYAKDGHFHLSSREDQFGHREFSTV